MNARDVKGLAVVVLADADKVGHVDDILFDAQYRQILGFRVKRGAFGRSETVLRRDVTAVGRDAITITSRASLNQEERFHELVGAATLAKVEGTHVVTEGGTRLGSIRSVELDDQAQRVAYYTLDRSLRERLFGEEPRLNAEYVRGIGERGIMVVANEAGMSPEEVGRQQRQQEQAAQPQATPTAQPSAQTEQGQPAQPMAPGAMAAGMAAAGGAVSQGQPAGTGASYVQPTSMDAQQGQPSVGQPQPGAQPQPGVYAGQQPMGPAQPGGYQDQPPMRQDGSQISPQIVRGGQIPPGMPGSDQVGRQERQDVPAPYMGQPSPHQQPLPERPMTNQPPMQPQPPLGNQPLVQAQPGVRQGPVEPSVNQAQGPVVPGVDQPQRPMVPPPNQGMPNQDVPDQVLPNQGLPNQGVQGQGLSNQGLPNQGLPSQGVPPQDQGQWGQGVPGQDQPVPPAENEQPLPPTYP